MVNRIISVLAITILAAGLFIVIFDPFRLFLIPAPGFIQLEENFKRSSPDSLTPPSLLAENDMESFARYVNNVWLGENYSQYEIIRARLDFPAQAVYIAFRSDGRRLYEGWATEGTTGDAITAIIYKARQELTPEQVELIDLLEISLGHSFQEYNLEDPQESVSLFSNIHRGVLGLEIVFRNRITERYAPTYIVASNRNNRRLIDLFREKYNLSEALFQSHGSVSAFQSEQILVMPGISPRAVLMERGNTFVDPGSVSRQSISVMAQLAGTWLRNNIHDDGRLTYKYWPASATESQANNMIRQWMASVALTRFGEAENNQDIIRLAEKNIDYNLANFYREENGFGLIMYRDQVKLGALALAALAILEHPEREKWQKEEEALQKTIDSLWNEDGSLTSFFIPEGDMRFQNFYPGEALLYWAQLYREDPDPLLLERFMKSFNYYRNWHLDPFNRNPAFIPWHTQAYYIIWELTGNEELKDFIFVMNDWLLPIQQWPEEPLYRDTLGRFYDPGRPFGPPHSSSTGVYLEGLIDAYALARKTGDIERAESYRLAINRGLRSVMQLQFVDETDMYYISSSMMQFVEGGIRTTVYDNEIRCDNVQHNVIAALKILEVFDDTDFNYY